MKVFVVITQRSVSRIIKEVKVFTDSGQAAVYEDKKREEGYRTVVWEGDIDKGRVIENGAQG